MASLHPRRRLLCLWLLERAKERVTMQLGERALKSFQVEKTESIIMGSWDLRVNEK